MENTRKLGVFLIALATVVVIIVSLWFALFFLSFFQNLSPSVQSSSSTFYNASYTSLLLGNNNNTKIVFGDTEYFLNYFGDSAQHVLYIEATLSSPVTIHPEIGHTYVTVGIEINVVNMSSDGVSSFILMNVRPTVENYMFSTYHYVRVQIPRDQGVPAQNGSQSGPPTDKAVTVNLASSSTNKTNQYTFEYPIVAGAASSPTYLESAALIVKTSTQTKQYEALIGFSVQAAERDFNLEIRIYQANSDFMVIYVRPLY